MAKVKQEIPNMEGLAFMLEEIIEGVTLKAVVREMCTYNEQNLFMAM